MRQQLLVGLSLIVFAAQADAQTALELFPHDGAVGVAIRDLNDLIKKGDEFLQASDIRLPVRPSQLFDQGAAFLGVNQGLNRRAPAAVVLLSPENGRGFKGPDVLALLVPVLPFTDADVMADNFRIAAGKLVPGSILKTKRGGNDFLTKYAGRAQQHIYLSESEKTLRRILGSKPLAASWSAAQRQRFDDSDVLVHLGRSVWRDEEFLAPDLVKFLRPGDDPREKEFAQECAASFREIEHVVTGICLRSGLDLHLLLTVPQEGRAAKLLASLRNQRGPSTLRGLPEGNVLFAQAAAGPADPQALLTRALFNFLLEEVFIPKKMVHHVDRLTYLGVFHEVWRRLQGHRLAVYQNAAESRQGLFSAVAVLDTEDAAAFLRDLKLLSNMGRGDALDLTPKEEKGEIDLERLVRNLASGSYNVRQAAHTQLALIGEPALPYLNRAFDSPQNDLETRRRAGALRDRIHTVAAQRRKELLDDKNQPLFVQPKLTFLTGVESRQGRSIDVIRVQLAGPEKTVTQRYTQLLGPDWDKVRLAVMGNQIVVLLGSDVALFESALRNVQKGDAGLAGTKGLAPFFERSSRDRLFEFHVSVEGIQRLTEPKANLDTPPQLSSIALTLGGQSLEVDARMPTPEVRTLARQAPLP